MEIDSYERLDQSWCLHFEKMLKCVEESSLSDSVVGKQAGTGSNISSWV